ncbi:MAG TPA: hypothetical protein VF573_07195 [Paraburkholderia sp.]|uniref:hypothetical protein n=1 Tax=Paraburkholderia sp. TaxID=1926495 RepID=UPI002ED230C8
MVTKLPELLRKKRGRGLAPDRSHFGYVSILLNATGLRKSPGIGYTRARVAAVSEWLWGVPGGMCGGALPCESAWQTWDRTRAVIVFEHFIGRRRSGMTALTCVILNRLFVMQNAWRARTKQHWVARRGSAGQRASGFYHDRLPMALLPLFGNAASVQANGGP